MKFYALWLPFTLALAAQDPSTLDQYRDQMNRINANPVTDLSDAATRSREALRAPLLAGPSRSLAEIQSAQTALSRLNDRMTADAERAAQSARDQSAWEMPTILRTGPPLTSVRRPASPAIYP